MPERVAILGAGLMGAQIGAEYALGGHPVTLITRSEGSGVDALGRARKALRYLEAERLASAEAVSEGLERLDAATDVALACAGAAVIVESLPEDLARKAGPLKVAAAAAPGAIIASNTSSIPIADIGAAAGAPERTIGAHYMNPPTLTPLVEVIPSQATAPEVTARLVALLRAMRKEPLLVSDVLGFAWNRLQFALLHEAVRLVRSGVTDAATIDRIVTHGLGRRWSLVGPFEVMALGGPRTFAAIAKLLFEDLEEPVDPEALLSLDLPAAAPDRIRQRDAALAALRRRDLGVPDR